MSTDEHPPRAAGGPAAAAPGAHHTAAPTLGGFEARLLAELQVVVAEQAATADPAGQPDGRGSASHPAARGPAGRAWPARRLALVGGLTAAVTAGLAVTLTLTLAGGGTSPNFAPATTAAAVLDNAALAALSEPAVTPRSDQFVYIKRFASYIDAATRRPRLPAIHGTEMDQMWLSVSGRRPGLNRTTTTARPGRTVRESGTTVYCPHGFGRPVADYQGLPDPSHVPCTASHFAAFQPRLPTTTAGMRAFLHRQGSLPESKQVFFDGPATAKNLISAVFYVVTEYYLTPAQQAAIYRALAAVPGLTVVPHVTAANGKAGVGVRYHSAAQRTDWTAIFDPTTFKPIGANIDLPGHHNRVVVVPPTIVDRVGELP
jgi:hypothetical protein